MTNIAVLSETGERIERYDIAIAGRRHRREAEIGRNNPHQPIIHRPGQRAAIEHQLGLEAQHVRRLAGVVFDAVVATLPQHLQQ
jgi:hypothetical protein